jgi:carboxymethylproline synthase
MTAVSESDEGSVRVITLRHDNRNNPFSAELEDGIKAALARANQDPKVGAVVVTGGKDRSFSAGGDFNEVRLLKGGEDVDDWIDRVTDLYLSVLKVEKPTVAAIDGYAIGMGCQFALMFDWRQAASTAEFRMPELRHGIGCSMGVAILRHAIGHAAMQDIVFACEPISAEQAAAYRIVNRLSRPETVLRDAIARAAELAAYPQVPYRATKATIVAGMRDVLEQSAETSKRVHRAAFAARSPHAHFARVLGQEHVEAADR